MGCAVSPIILASRIFALCLCLFLFISSRAYPAVITGGETVYRVVEGDSLLLISAKLGADMKRMARENNLDPGKDLRPGQELRLNTRKIAPRAVDDRGGIRHSWRPDDGD